MTVTTTASRGGGTSHRGPGAGPARLWWLVAAGAFLAVVGIAAAVVVLVRPDLAQPARGPAAVGAPVRTGFGTFTVTALSTTFVPDTQGPPSQAQHNGGTGTQQLNVRVRLTNDRWDRGLQYSAEQFRLVESPVGGSRPPDGSTLATALLPRGATVDGQLWFDAVPGRRAAGRQWLEYVAPGGQRIRVPLAVAATPSPRPAPSSPGHDH